MITIFIKDGIQTTGMGRYAFGISVAENTRVIYVEDITKTDFMPYTGDVGIFAGWLAGDIIAYTGNFADSYLIYCSPFGQMDLSSQGFYSAECAVLFNALSAMSDGRLTNIIATSDKLAHRLGLVHLPAVIPDLSSRKQLFDLNRSGLSFLGNNRRKHKNVVNTLAGMSVVANSLQEEIIVNNTEDYELYGQLFGCKFKAFSAAKDDDFFAEISKHRLLYQCSYSESFDYLALEYAYMGVPCVCSNIIEWYPIKDCMVNNLDNWQEICDVGLKLLASDARYADYSHILSVFAKHFNAIQTELLMERVKLL